MPLVKQGRITTDLFVHIADGAELLGDGAVLITAWVAFRRGVTS